MCARACTTLAAVLRATRLQDFRIPVVLALLAGVSQWLSFRALNRVAVHIALRPAADPAFDAIDVTHLTLLGTATKSYLRKGIHRLVGAWLSNLSWLTVSVIACANFSVLSAATARHRRAQTVVAHHLQV